MSEKDFFWNLFLNTGSIEAYLLLKESTNQKNPPLKKEN